MPTWTIAAFTHRGRVRPHNEDTVGIGNRILTGDMDSPLVITAQTGCALLMIADGMGGHAQGAMASRAVLDYLVAAADRLSDPAYCAEVIEEANQHLFGLMHEHEEALGMGSTIVGAVLGADQLVTFNVGDSRCYLFSSGQLLQLSQDDVPGAKRNQFGAHRSHALTQALGGSPLPAMIDPHVSADAPLATGEALLLCSDGLTDMVPDYVIRDILSRATSPTMAIRYLVPRVLRAGGRDNISLVIARLAERSDTTDFSRDGPGSVAR
ncbi:hypothetical protein CK489_08180 [Bradyrhizobium sp. UFLA03-84]|uniref:PP2C family protein-serine/threonine phosphatase n=1 Tax=Bradyrhizobium sp. UFLA03-84 TaxID=418599 RepID=UPI000BAE35DA|nr:protein phosphatase 2C domain-containing protein [Bradyrhizobium sp. UFLA03-84]PAY09312.1 hypothetical protein CK489_08180 [Bradyrhizobium sp. UFLA03-84]